MVDAALPPLGVTRPVGRVCLPGVRLAMASEDRDVGPVAAAPPDTLRVVAGEFDEIRSRLEAIAEELADLALIRLRESIDAGGTELPVDEKRLTRARRAVEKAAHLLAETDDG